MVWAGTAAAVISAGTGIYSAVKGSGGSGGGGGGGPTTGQTNPAMSFVGPLFGTRWNPKKGWVTDESSGALGSIFGSGSRQYLQDLMTPNPIYQPALDMADRAVDQSTLAIPAAQNDISTAMGWLANLNAGPTSIDPIIASRKWDLYNQTMPGLSERFSGSTGTFGAATDFWGQVARESAGMEAKLGELDFDAQEAWKNRMAQTAPAYATLGTTRAGLPLAMASDALGLSTAKRNAVQAAKPGNDVLSVLGALSGYGSQNNVYQSGHKPVSDTAALLAGLGQTLPTAIQNWYDRKPPSLTGTPETLPATGNSAYNNIG